MVPALRHCLEMALTCSAVASSPTESALHCQWLDDAHLPTSAEGSLALALKRLAAVLYSALSAARREERLQSFALCHQYAAEEYLVALAIPSELAGVVEAQAVAFTGFELYAQTLGTALSLEQTGYPPALTGDRFRLGEKTAAVFRDGDAFLAPAVSACAITLGLLSGAPRIVTDVCTSSCSSGGGHAIVPVALELPRSAPIQDVLQAARSAMAPVPRRALGTIQSRAGIALVSDDARATSIRCGEMCAVMLPVPHFADWGFKLTCYTGEAPAVSIDTFFAPPTVTTLYVHVLERVLTTNAGPLSHVTRVAS